MASKSPSPPRSPTRRSRPLAPSADLYSTYPASIWDVRQTAHFKLQRHRVCRGFDRFYCSIPSKISIRGLAVWSRWGNRVGEPRDLEAEAAFGTLVGDSLGWTDERRFEPTCESSWSPVQIILTGVAVAWPSPGPGRRGGAG